MSKFVHLGVALGALGLVLWFAACSAHTGPPALVLQAFHVTRARASESAYERRRELAFSASVSVALDRGAVAGGVASAGESSRPVDLAAVGCGPPSTALCQWAEAEEQAVWLAALAESELSP